VGFRPVYIGALFGGCNANRCLRIWEAGEPLSAAKGNQRYENDFVAVSAMMFADSMLPLEVRVNNPTFGGGLGEVELVR